MAPKKNQLRKENISMGKSHTEHIYRTKEKNVLFAFQDNKSKLISKKKQPKRRGKHSNKPKGVKQIGNFSR